MDFHSFFCKLRNKNKARKDRRLNKPQEQQQHYQCYQQQQQKEDQLNQQQQQMPNLPYAAYSYPRPPFHRPRAVLAVYDFEAPQDNECSFNKDDILIVSDTSNEWWQATNVRTKKDGLIPSNYVSSDLSQSIVLEAFFDVDRAEAEYKLLVPGVQFGTYILRPCMETNIPYSLSVRAKGVAVKHFRVYFDKAVRQYYLSVTTRFSSLERMLTYYQSNTIDGEVGLMEPRSHRVVVPMDLDECEINYAYLTLERELGRGNFGAVYKGRIGNMPVAVKKSLNENSDKAFLEEVKVMHILAHQRIVRFLGFCRSEPDGRILIVTEFMANGSLLDYLHKPEGRSLQYSHLISIIDQVVKAMVYLEKIKVVHRDLRAANVLVHEDRSVKVADFGLTLISGVDQTNVADTFPIRWTAPEVLIRSLKPTTKSDVWSFGILMFEVLTYGQTPYMEYTKEQVSDLIEKGGQLQSPCQYGHTCDEEVYKIMKSCWNRQPEKRPTFREISQKIEGNIRKRERVYYARWDNNSEN
ncbi:tyrosine protein kinase Fgr [Echinococcus multilocularis]|uniref:Tyrosine-protein kinase n=1 Tax=Echinococcus multilocularis TaxID=6211 RepID=A0A068Y6G4_ECHMU|nr:tyrosine protein kinase Fgr [Echinococcus multilocularis]